MPDDRTYGFNVDDANSLLQSISSSEQSYVEIAPRAFSSETAVVLDEVLTAASHALTGAASALATVCEWSVADNDYTETAKQITVWNHSESTDHAVDTFGIARWINGHWHFFGDCIPMAAR